MKYKWLLFDADGTLFDYEHASLTSLRKLFDRFGLEFGEEHHSKFEEINDQLWSYIENKELNVSLLSIKRFEILIDHFGFKCNPSEFSKTYLELLTLEAKLIDNAKVTISILSQNYSLMIITNGNKLVQRRKFDNSDIGHYFQDYVISNEVDAVKPDKKIFDICFERMEFPSKDEVLIVGDSLTSDIKGGKDYGIDTCWFNPKQIKNNSKIIADFEINNLDELITSVCK